MIRWILRKLFGNEGPRKKEDFRKDILDSLEEQRVMGQILESQQNAPQEIQSLASVTFFIDPSHHIHIQYQWNDEKDVAIAKNLAHMLFLINNGELEMPSVSVLQKLGQNYPEQHVFVGQVFDHWRQLKEEGDVIVPPSQVFNMGYGLKDRERQE